MATRYLRNALAAGRISSTTSSLFISVYMCQWFMKSSRNKKKTRIYMCYEKNARKDRDPRLKISIYPT